jgi:outer membrane protein
MQTKVVLTKSLVAKSLLAGLAGSLVLGGTAMAQSDPSPGVGKAANTVMVRARLLGVIPLDSNSSISGIGGTVNATNTVTPEVDISYFLTDNLALELIAATTKHTINADGTALGNLKVGTTWVLPPALTAQYHFNPKGAISPYLGLGINYTIFYATDASAPVTSLSIQNNWGFVMQAGVDWNFSGHWFANFDVKQIIVSTQAKLNGGAIVAKTGLNPLIIGAGVGYRF